MDNINNKKKLTWILISIATFCFLFVKSVISINNVTLIPGWAFGLCLYAVVLMPYIDNIIKKYIISGIERKETQYNVKYNSYIENIAEHYHILEQKEDNHTITPEEKKEISNIRIKLGLEQRKYFFGLFYFGQLINLLIPTVILIFLLYYIGSGDLNNTLNNLVNTHIQSLGK
ncbi:MAG: hypothetical protein ACYCTB_11715 [bacterium]